MLGPNILSPIKKRDHFILFLNLINSRLKIVLNLLKNLLFIAIIAINIQIAAILSLNKRIIRLASASLLVKNLFEDQTDNKLIRRVDIKAHFRRNRKIFIELLFSHEILVQM